MQTLDFPFDVKMCGCSHTFSEKKAEKQEEDENWIHSLSAEKIQQTARFSFLA